MQYLFFIIGAVIIVGLSINFLKKNKKCNDEIEMLFSKLQDTEETLKNAESIIKDLDEKNRKITFANIDLIRNLTARVNLCIKAMDEIRQNHESIEQKIFIIAELMQNNNPASTKQLSEEYADLLNQDILINRKINETLQEQKHIAEQQIGLDYELY